MTPPQQVPHPRPRAGEYHRCLKASNAAYFRDEDFELASYMENLLDVTKDWQPLASPVIFFITNIKCEDVLEYAGLNRTMDGERQWYYGYELASRNIRVRATWIDVS